MRFTFAVFFNFVIRMLPLIAGLGLLVTGIMIAAGKKKSVKVLGIGYIIESISAILRSLMVFVSRRTNVRTFASYSVASTFISVLCTVGFLLCVCIYIHKNYGKKLIYIPVLSIYVVGSIISRIVSVVLSRTISGESFALWISMTSNINSFVIDAAIALIIIIVFYKNRKNEPVIPKAWLFKTIAIAGFAFGTLIQVLYYLSMINGSKGIFRSDYLVSLALAFLSLVAVITPVYVTVMAYRGKKLPEQV